jgi:hypothetical protein
MIQRMTQIKFERATVLHVSAEVGPEYFLPVLTPVFAYTAQYRPPSTAPRGHLMRYRNSDGRAPVGITETNHGPYRV